MHPFKTELEIKLFIKFKTFLITFISKTMPRQLVVNDKRTEIIKIKIVIIVCNFNESFLVTKNVFIKTSLHTNASNGKLNIIIIA